MAENKNDLEFERGILTRKINSGEDVIIETDRAVVLRNVTYPRAELHFSVLPKEDIVNVTKLKHEHLPLLDHMMDLANQIIEKQHWPSSYFRVGFKINAFMNRLNMHVISDDFCSAHMRKHQHWNSFNTDLFLPFQAVYALLSVYKCVEPMPHDVVNKLLNAQPSHCNQCSFKTKSFHTLAEHLETHWRRRTNQRLYITELTKLSQSMGTLQLNANVHRNRLPMRHPFNILHGALQNQFLHHPRGLFGPQQRFQAPKQHFRSLNSNSLNYMQGAPHLTAKISEQSTPKMSEDSGETDALRQQQVVDVGPHQPSDVKQSLVKKKYHKWKAPQANPAP